jgi:hypothetical protein
MSIQLDPYPDELLVSIIARYRLYSGKSGSKEVLRDIFGTDSARPSLHLPSHLGRMAESGHFGASAESLLYMHTLYPYYAPFLSPNIADRVKKDMLSDKGIGVHSESGLVASRVPLLKRMVVCPGCIHDDILTFGEPYWHRSHHLPGVISCPKHQMKLYDRCPYCNVPLTGLAVQELPYPMVACPNGHALLHRCAESNLALNQIASDSEFILHNAAPWKSVEDLQERYVNTLFSLEMATPAGRIRQRELSERFLKHFPATLWDVIKIEAPTPDQEWSWLRELVRRPKKAFHPLLHILLMEFLGGDAPHFFERAHFAPFGYGPWPCLNKAATHYLENVVRDLTITICTDTRRPVGTFRCECGFVYSRRGPDNSEEDCVRYGRIKAFGHVWEEKLNSLLSEGECSVRGLARELGTDPRVIKSRYGKHGSFPIPIHVHIEKQLERDMRRKRFEITLRMNPGVSRSKLRHLNYRDFQWLYRHDRKWLKKVLPSRRKGRGSMGRVDWDKRDREMSILVEQAARSILNTADKPVRVTLGLIGRICGRKALLEHHLDKLPTTKKVLNDYLESTGEFQKRRIDWAVVQISGEHEDFVAWKIIRKSGLRTPVSQDISDYIGQILIEITEQGTM